MSRKFRNSLFSIFLGLTPTLIAQTAANQLVVSGNACGPTALLNAFRFGKADWQVPSNSLKGETDKERIYTIIREYGMRPSNHLKGRPRWSRKGLNLADLCDIGNEMTRGTFLPPLTTEIAFLKPGETQAKLLKRIHQHLATSIAKGFPPLISLRRYALRTKGEQAAQWTILDAHFVTLIAVPTKLENAANGFAVTYLDPWGGKTCQGQITIPTAAVLAADLLSSPCLTADFPQASVGKKLTKPGEPSALTVAALLGRW